MSVPPRLDPYKIFRALVRHDVVFVAIGGVATYMQGSSRITYDLDVTPREETSNLDRLSVALKDLGAKIWVNEAVDPLDFPFDGKSLARARNWNLVTNAGRLDILLEPDGMEDFERLHSGASAEEIESGVVVRIASIDDLIRMKLAAGRDKDLQDVRDLQLILEARAREGSD